MAATSFCQDCGSDTEFCTGGTAISCVYGYVIARQHCPATASWNADLGNNMAGCST